MRIAIVAILVCGCGTMGAAPGTEHGRRTGTCEPAAQLDTDLTAADQDDVISLSGTNPLNCPEISMSETWDGGQLLLSDSPESPTTKGKLFEDTTLAATSGTDYHRVFSYHVNNSGSTKRFVVVLKNTSGSSGTLTTQKVGRAGPSTSFAYAGKLAFERWLNSTAGGGATVTAGSWAQVDTTFNGTNVSTGNLYHMILDYSFTQTHQLAICMTDTTDTPTTYCPTATLLSRDSHVRGTCPNSDKVYDTASGIVIDTADGIQQFPIAGDTTNDTNAACVDETDSTNLENSGNYGVLYRMHLETEATDSANIGFLFNPRGGQWGGAVWAMTGGLLAGGKFLIPPTSGTTGDNTKGAVEGRYSPGAGLTVWLQFMPTGGSAFPLRFVAVPH